jgi:hypothetical protein
MGGGCHFYTFSRNGDQGASPSALKVARILGECRPLTTVLGGVLSGHLGPVGGGGGVLLPPSSWVRKDCSPAPGWAPSGCGPAGPVRSWCRPLSRCVWCRHSSQTPDLDGLASAVNAVCPKFFSKLPQQGSSRC